jgi:DNA modification methylase
MTPYYQDDFATIYHGDCRDVLPTLSGAAVLTDPPYGVGKGYDTHDDAGGDEYWDFMRDVVRLSLAAAPVLAMTHRVLALRELDGWDWVCGWVKRNQQMRLFSMPVLPTWEPIICWGIKGLATNHRADTFHIDAIPSNAVPGGHPFPKPPKLMSALIDWLCPVGTIIDPFLGSGTTLRVAKDYGRHAIGIEKSERYCEVAARRLSQEVFDFGAVS